MKEDKEEKGRKRKGEKKRTRDEVDWRGLKCGKLKCGRYHLHQPGKRL
jgi:hypothetical protein